MAMKTLPQDDSVVEDGDFDHEIRIAERVLSGIYPSELPDDVDAAGVAYFIWARLTSALLVCGWNQNDLLQQVRDITLEDAESEGNA